MKKEYVKSENGSMAWNQDSLECFHNRCINYQRGIIVQVEELGRKFARR